LLLGALLVIGVSIMGIRYQPDQIRSLLKSLSEEYQHYREKVP
jgi:hypothetical protein